MILSELKPNCHKGINRLPRYLLGCRRQVSEVVMFLTLSFVLLVVRHFGWAAFQRSDRIIKEGYNESNYLEPDSVGGCNRYSVVGGNEHMDQRAGTTATRPKTARHKKAKRSKKAATAGQ